jgi:hypothetical protein
MAETSHIVFVPLNVDFLAQESRRELKPPGNENSEKFPYNVCE